MGILILLIVAYNDLNFHYKKEMSNSNEQSWKTRPQSLEDKGLKWRAQKSVWNLMSFTLIKIKIDF